MIKLSSDKITRLAFARYLLAQAKIHVDKGSPLSSFTILILHDLVEIFLQVAAEVNIPEYAKKRDSILNSLTSELNKKLKSDSKQPISESYIKTLNDVRNSLKHNTIFVNPDVVKELYVGTEEFIKGFLPVLFEVELEKISLVALIRNISVRENLEAAEENLAISKTWEAMLSIAKAYHFLLAELIVTNIAGQNVLDDSWKAFNSHKYQNAGSYRANSQEFEKRIDTLSNLVVKDFEYINEKCNSIEQALLLGVDYRKFLKFINNKPHIFSSSSSKAKDEFIVPGRPVNYTVSDVQFSLDFLIDVTFKMQSTNVS